MVVVVLMVVVVVVVVDRDGYIADRESCLRAGAKFSGKAKFQISFSFATMAANVVDSWWWCWWWWSTSSLLTAADTIPPRRVPSRES